ERLRSQKEALRATPGSGRGYGALRYLRGPSEIAYRAPVAFNYLGQLDASFGPDSLFSLARESSGPPVAPENGRTHAIDVNASLKSERLEIVIGLGPARLASGRGSALADSFTRALRSLIIGSRSPVTAVLSPSDFPAADLDQAELDAILSRLVGPAAPDPKHPT